MLICEHFYVHIWTPEYSHVIKLDDHIRLVYDHIRTYFWDIFEIFFFILFVYVAHIWACTYMSSHMIMFSVVMSLSSPQEVHPTSVWRPSQLCRDNHEPWGREVNFAQSLSILGYRSSWWSKMVSPTHTQQSSHHSTFGCCLVDFLCNWKEGSREFQQFLTCSLP